MEIESHKMTTDLERFKRKERITRHYLVIFSVALLLIYMGWGMRVSTIHQEELAKVNVTKDTLSRRVELLAAVNQEQAKNNEDLLHTVVSSIRPRETVTVVGIRVARAKKADRGMIRSVLPVVPYVAISGSAHRLPWTEPEVTPEFQYISRKLDTLLKKERALSPPYDRSGGLSDSSCCSKGVRDSLSLIYSQLKNLNYWKDSIQWNKLKKLKYYKNTFGIKN